MKGAEKIKRAETLLKSLELTQSYEQNLLLGALAEAKKKKPTDTSVEDQFLPCGDATCDLVDRGDGRVEIGYSFAL